MSRRLRKEVEEGQVTVGWYLSHRLGFTRAQIKSMKFRPAGILVNGTRVRVTQTLNPGDLLELLLEDEPPASGTKENAAAPGRGGKEPEPPLNRRTALEESNGISAAARRRRTVLEGSDGESEKPQTRGENAVPEGSSGRSEASWRRRTESEGADGEPEKPQTRGENAGSSGSSETARSSRTVPDGADAERVPVRVLPSEGPLEILYEDEDVIAVWKPAGMVSHPGPGHYRDSLANLLQGYLMKKEGEMRPCPTAASASSDPPLLPIRGIGRLDRDTSGILVFGKNAVAAQRLWEQRERGVFRKEYLALCRGIFPEEARLAPQTIDAPIGKQEGELNKMCVTPKGSPAITHYQVLNQWEDRTLLRLTLETGRTHQIRVHLAHIGHPLIGDPIYDTFQTPPPSAPASAQRSAPPIGDSACDTLPVLSTDPPALTQRPAPSPGTPVCDMRQVPRTEISSGPCAAQQKTAENTMFLCAWRTRLCQPFTGSPIEISRRPDHFFLPFQS